MEAIRSRRDRLANEARTKGQAFTRPVEKLPDMRSGFGPWLSAAFPFSRTWDDLTLDSVCLPEVVGKKFNRIIDNYLTPLRNDIAHIIIESGEITLSTDDLLHAQKISRWLPVTRCIVRHMLRNEFPAKS
jgi:hypothetical protein